MSRPTERAAVLFLPPHPGLGERTQVQTPSRPPTQAWPGPMRQGLGALYSELWVREGRLGACGTDLHIHPWASQNPSFPSSEAQARLFKKKKKHNSLPTPPLP